MKLDRAPGKLACYAHSVFLPRKPPGPLAVIPSIALSRPALRMDEAHLARYRAFFGIEPSGYLPFLYPLSLLFHYHLGIFGDRRFPWSLRRMLGLRNHVVQHRRIAAGARLDLDVRTGAQRVLPKGLEFDFHTVLAEGGNAVWESVHVYYLRGEFTGEPAAPLDFLQPLEAADFETSWDAPAGGGREYARICGDFNPAHFSDAWGRALGFKRAFSHTQRTIAQCLERLPAAAALEDAERVQLDVAFKGPVYYGSRLTMRASGGRFDLYCGDGPKPAMPGRLIVNGGGT